MPLLTAEETVASTAPPATKPTLLSVMESRLSDLIGPQAPWNRTTLWALAALVLLWAARFYGTWATWGHLTIDCGRELYVATALSEGKTLYRDLWYPYNPLAPYVNALLFHWFGASLHVFYWAGSLSALGCAVFLYLTGMRLGSWLIGWTTAAVVLIQSFHAYIFSFPLSYSFASVYGCLASCAFLWLAIRAATAQGPAPMFAAGSAAAATMLFKLEYGLACYAVLFLLIVLRSFRWGLSKALSKDLLAILPGIAVCIATAAWMVSLAGASFITQENLQHWPTSHFLNTYGKIWLEFTGASLSASAFLYAALRTVLVAAVAWMLFRFLRRTNSDESEPFLIAGLGIGALAVVAGLLPWQGESFFRIMFFPQDMVLYDLLAALLCAALFYGAPASDRMAKLTVLLALGGILGFRVLLGMTPSGYPVYYNGPAILGFLMLARLLLPPARSPRFTFHSEGLLCFACLAAVVLHAAWIRPPSQQWVLMQTDRGEIRVPPSFAVNYQAAVAFMKEKAAQGQTVISVPEGASLYFLSHTRSPLRLHVFTPGALVPGRMTDALIREMERAPADYLLWSNLTYEEYGVPVWGTDVDRPLGDYLRAHYRPLAPVGPVNDPATWNAVIWQRQPASDVSVISRELK
jgi:hypothetical protein